MSYLVKMKFVAIDIQGFDIPEFVVKELAIFDGTRVGYFLFKPSKPWSSIEDENIKNNIKYLQNYAHCINYSSGYIEYDELPHVLKKYFIEQDIDRIYVNGMQKKIFLEDFLTSCELQHIEVIATDWMQDCPLMLSERPLCMNHTLKSHTKKCLCSVNICQTLYNWIVNKLPSYILQ